MGFLTNRERHFSTIFSRVVIVVSFFSVIALALFVSLSEYNRAKTDIATLQEKTYRQKKEIIKSAVQKAVNLINVAIGNIDVDMRNSLKNRTYEAHKTITHLYNTFKGKLSEDKLQLLIVESLRPIRFSDNKGYFFVVSLDGTEILYPPFPEFEGQNLLELQDSQGNYAIRDEIKVVKNQGEGFVTNYWPIPGRDKKEMYEKISFVKAFEPFGWYIGCGEYLVERIEMTQKKVIAQLENNSFYEDGYIFVNTYDGIAKIIHSNIYKPGDDISEIEDSNGVKIFHEELLQATKAGGGFVEYEWIEPDVEKPIKNLSYIYGVDAWRWMVGAWTNIEEINAQILVKKNQLIKDMVIRVVVVTIILILILVVVIILTRLIGKKINTSFKGFINDLGNALNNKTRLKNNDYEFKELSSLSTSVNQLLDERNEMYKKVENSEKELRNIFSNAPFMILSVDNDGRLFFYNQKVEQLLGHATKNIKTIRQAYRTILKGSSNLRSRFMKVLKNPGEFHEFEIEAKDGTLRIQNWASYIMSDNKIILFGYDITELKHIQQQLSENEKELQKSNATKNQFFSIIAHDLRNPLNAMLGFANILKEEYDDLDDDERKEIVNNMVVASESMSKLLSNLLEWSQLQMGRLSISPEVVPINDILNENINLQMPHAKSKMITIRNNTKTENLQVLADQKMIDTVLRNLISNAVKFTPSGGIIETEARMEQDAVEVCIQDNGVGMTPEEAEKIFDIGIKMKKSGTANEKGTGLGLTLAKEFIEKNNGTISVKSNKGKGSKFIIRLPKA
jgi:PAS domain S-box-containing protein